MFPLQTALWLASNHTCKYFHRHPKIPFLFYKGGLCPGRQNGPVEKGWEGLASKSGWALSFKAASLSPSPPHFPCLPSFSLVLHFPNFFCCLLLLTAPLSWCVYSGIFTSSELQIVLIQVNKYLRSPLSCVSKLTWVRHWRDLKKLRVCNREYCKKITMTPY